MDIAFCRINMEVNYKTIWNGVKGYNIFSHPLQIKNMKLNANSIS